MRDWGLDEATCKAGRRALRYRSPIEKGIAWYWCSRYIRERDERKYGSCISCGKKAKLQAGHFIPASKCGNEMLMLEENLSGECARCNCWDEGHLLGYERGLDERYGKGTAQKLKDLYFRNKENIIIYKKSDWEKIAKSYKELI